MPKYMLFQSDGFFSSIHSNVNTNAIILNKNTSSSQQEELKGNKNEIAEQMLGNVCKDTGKKQKRKEKRNSIYLNTGEHRYLFLSVFVGILHCF